MPKIIQIPGRSGFYLRVAVPRGKLRDAFGTCDVVKKIGNTRKEAEENISAAEVSIQHKFNEKIREEETKRINRSLPKGIKVEAVKDSDLKEFWLDDIFPGLEIKDIFAVFDDRNQVVDMWRQNGLTCFQVADGDF